MQLPRRSGLPLRFMLAAIAAISSAGCREELGPEPMPTVRVSGSVVEGSRPVGGGWIEFIPLDGTVGNIRSARLRPDGSFMADGVAVGKNAIRLVQAPIQLPDGPRLFGAFTTTIRREIPIASQGPLKIDLVDELIRGTVERERSARRPARGEGTTQ